MGNKTTNRRFQFSLALTVEPQRPLNPEIQDQLTQALADLLIEAHGEDADRETQPGGERDER